MAAGLFNDLLHGGDEDYEKIHKRDKDRNFLFKLDDGVFLKIPKGRVLSILGAAAENISKGKDGDWSGFIGLVGEQISPVNPFTSNIASAWLRYGGQ